MPDTGQFDYYHSEARAGRPIQSIYTSSSPDSLIIGLCGVVIATLAVHFLSIAVTKSWSFLPSLAQEPVAWRAAGVATLIVGFLLYGMKVRYLIGYAMLELSVAAFTAYHAMSQLAGSQQRLSFLLAFLGSIYVAVRGFSNLADAVPAISRLVARSANTGTKIR